MIRSGSLSGSMKNVLGMIRIEFPWRRSALSECLFHGSTVVVIFANNYKPNQL